MKVNNKLFLDLLKKGTFNYSIDTIKMIFDKEGYSIGMRFNDGLVLLRGQNDIISGINDTDEIEMCFSDVLRSVKTYFSLITPDDNGEVDIIVSDEKITLVSDKERADIYFCVPNIVDSYSKSDPGIKGTVVYESGVNDEFMDIYSSIKKVGASFGKIYLTIEDGMFYIECTDKMNPASNGIKALIGNSKYDSNISVCFSFKSFNNMIELIKQNYLDFVFSIDYIENNKACKISMICDVDHIEKYFILNMIENIA